MGEKKRRYAVAGILTTTGFADVDAVSFEDAVRIAEEEMGIASFCHQCGRGSPNNEWGYNQLSEDGQPEVIEVIGPDGEIWEPPKSVPRIQVTDEHADKIRALCARYAWAVRPFSGIGSFDLRAAIEEVLNV